MSIASNESFGIYALNTFNYFGGSFVEFTLLLRIFENPSISRSNILPNFTNFDGLFLVIK